ncbi:hypothetical protein [Streptomyces sp. NPDC051994]
MGTRTVELANGALDSGLLLQGVDFVDEDGVVESGWTSFAL